MLNALTFGSRHSLLLILHLAMILVLLSRIRHVCCPTVVIYVPSRTLWPGATDKTDRNDTDDLNLTLW